MRTYTFAGIVLVSLLIIPFGAEAARKPTVSIEAPTKSDSYDRTAKMPVQLSFANVARTMVVEITTTLKKQDRSSFPVGYVGGGTYQFAIYAGQSDYNFSIDWGANDTIPGKYEMTATLKECNPSGCTYAPPGRALSSRSKKVSFALTNSAPWTSQAMSGSGTSIRLLSPNGDSSYAEGSSLTLRWEADNVPKGSTIMTYLIQQRTGIIFVFPGQNIEKRAKDGKGSIKGKLTRTAGYNLAPGEYWAKVAIVAPDPGTGKDAPTLAEDISDNTFTLR